MRITNADYNEYKEKYSKYTTGVVLKRVLTYAMKSKFLILASAILLIGFTMLELISPLLVRSIIDDELLGIQTTWVEVDQASDKTITYDNIHYIRIRDYKDTYTTSISLVYYESNYYVVSGEVTKEDILLVNGNTVTTKLGDFAISDPLTKDEIVGFYQASIQPITNTIILFAIISVSILILRYLQNIMFTAASMRLTRDMRKSAFAKLNRLPIDYFTEEPNGKIVSKITNDSEGVRGLYQVLFSIMSAVVSLLLVYSGLFIIDWRLALWTFVASPVILLWMTVYRKVNNKFHHLIREMNSRINGSLAEYVSGVGIIQLFNKEIQMKQEYDDLLSTNYKTKMKALKINSIFGWELLMFIRRLLVAGTVFYFGYRYLNLGIVVSAGLIYVYVNYVERLIDPISDIFNNLNALEDSVVASSRIFHFLDTEEDLYIGDSVAPRFAGDIEFKDVTFQYKTSTSKVLDNINCKIERGQFIGLVGHTGSGKTTMMSLLQRFYDLKEGQILIDGVDYMNYTKQQVRSNIGYILQDPAMFVGSIKSNIVFEKEVSDEEVISILRQIGADRFIDNYPQGIHTEVAYMGENLSTGEKQLIAFARILLRNPSIIILDEATANIDTQTESIIQTALKVISSNRTTFVVAHRLSTIKNADNIFVLQDGRVMESGKHTTLYRKKGIYRAMYDAQHKND